MTDAVPPGPLTDWLRRDVPRVAVGDGPVAVERISGGHSNLTYGITDAAGRRFALRRPPTGMVLATAHDMGREWRFISALAPTPVPVPPPVAFCADPDVIGADFYLTEFVDGDVLGDEASGHRLAPAQTMGEVARPTGLPSVATLLPFDSISSCWR